MGISLSACKTLKKEVKQFMRPKVESVMQLDIDKEFPDCDKYYPLVSEVWLHSSMDNEFCESDYNEAYFESHKQSSQKYFDQVKTFEDSPMKQWMLSHEGKFISFNYYHGFWVSNELEVIEREVYVASDYICVNEDSRLLMYAVDNMKELYGINLSAFISRDDLNCYLPEVIKNLEDNLKEIDSIAIAKEAEEKLKFIIKKENDEFFDERMLRVHKIINALKQGAIFIMSV
jgi:hypothetical protein